MSKYLRLAVVVFLPIAVIHGVQLYLKREKEMVAKQNRDRETRRSSRILPPTVTVKEVCLLHNVLYRKTLASLVMGPFNWKALSPSQQKEFMEKFINSIIYPKFLSSESLASYYHNSTKFKVELSVSEVDLSRSSAIEDIMTFLVNHFRCLSSLGTQNSGVIVTKKISLVNCTMSPTEFLESSAAHLLGMETQKIKKKGGKVELEQLLNSNFSYPEKLKAEAQELSRTIGETLNERKDALNPETIQTQLYTIQILREKLQKLKEKRAKLRTLDEVEIKDKIERCGELKKNRALMTNKLFELSAKGELPYNYPEARKKKLEKKAFLESLKQEVGQLQENAALNLSNDNGSNNSHNSSYF